MIGQNCILILPVRHHCNVFTCVVDRLTCHQSKTTGLICHCAETDVKGLVNLLCLETDDRAVGLLLPIRAPKKVCEQQEGGGRLDTVSEDRSDDVSGLIGSLSLEQKVPPEVNATCGDSCMNCCYSIGSSGSFFPELVLIQTLLFLFFTFAEPGLSGMDRLQKPVGTTNLP
jgi:hypothetical protein